MTKGKKTLKTDKKSSTTKPKLKAKSEADEIVISRSEGLVFSSEEELFNHFKPVIDILEKKLFSLRVDDDISLEDYKKYEEHLNETLDFPDEVWEDTQTIEGKTLNHFVATYEVDGESITYVATVYMTHDLPSFIYLHFPTQDPNLLEAYCLGELIFNQDFEQVEFAALEGDALSDGDFLSIGLFKAMLTLRGENDVSDHDYKKFSYLRNDTIENADEIWRNIDLSGNILVSFVKEHPDEGVYDLHYIVVTQEDEDSNVHSLLFSFPTKDKSLVDRYRHGTNLQSNEKDDKGASH